MRIRLALTLDVDRARKDEPQAESGDDEAPAIYDLMQAQTERAGRQPIGFQIQMTENEGDE